MVHICRHLVRKRNLIHAGWNRKNVGVRRRQRVSLWRGFTWTSKNLATRQKRAPFGWDSRLIEAMLVQCAVIVVEAWVFSDDEEVRYGTQYVPYWGTTGAHSSCVLFCSLNCQCA